MVLDHPAALKIAQSYFATNELLERLGWGISGYVYLSPDARTAVKVHRREESYQRELEVYLRLRRLRITRLHGLTIPKLRGYRDDLRLIQMDTVTAPFLLDFAGTLLDPPDWTDDRLAETIAEKFGPNAWLAHLVYDSLARHGLYYVDFRQTNLKLDGHPALELPEPPESDDT
jgi:hypothetical protein